MMLELTQTVITFFPLVGALIYAVTSTKERTVNQETKKPVCKLVGTDGNVFSIIGTVSKCLVKAGLREQAQEFKSKAFKSPSYGAVLNLCSEYVEVR